MRILECDSVSMLLNVRRSRSGEMKVLHVSAGISPRIGGSAMMALESAPALRAMGIETRLFAPDLAVGANASRYWTISRDDLAQLPAHARVFRSHRPRRLVFSPALYAALRREAGDYDVVHIHNLWTFPQFAAYRQASRHDVPYVVAPCGALDPLRRGRSRRAKAVTNALWQERMLDGARLVHFKTRAEAERAADLVPPEKGVVVPNGIRWESFQHLPDAAGFRRQHLQGHDGTVVLTVGRISWEKRLDLLIRAFAQVAAEIADAILVIVGPDDEGLGVKLERLARELGIGSRVRFTGPLTGRKRLQALAAADVWCQSSEFENFGLAAIEALAAGLPEVITEGVQLAPEIGAAGAALVVAHGPDAFAADMRRLLHDTALRRELSERGRAFARDFDWSSIAPRLASMYRRAVACDDAGGRGRSA
jgi:glycosyltransferase involved in cell wall biosynthesis